jgi:cyclohexa-1,5-dienecarbonyl-CoA hydratase
MADKVRTRVSHDGAVLRIALAAPPGNVIDSLMIRELGEVLASEAARPGLKALVLEGEGRHFSFGASVEEHAPERVREMLPAFHRLFALLAERSLPSYAIVRGRCLGGGLELAAYAMWIAASPEASLGQPEVKLGVFAPAGSLVLPRRVGEAAAAELLTTGRTLTAAEALVLGLIDAVAADPEKAVLEHIERHLLGLSAAALRFATRAARRGLHQEIASELPGLEALYLEELMASHDAREGIAAFLAKRPAAWRDA